MTINEKKMKMTSVQLSGYEMNTLKDAKLTLNLLFGKLTSRDNITRAANILNGIESLIEELEENNNSILEFDNMED